MLEDNTKIMISKILTSEVAASEQLGLLSGSLWGEEVEALGRSISKRRAEFAAGRTCARNALEALGVPPQSILCGIGREPQWPAGIVGSITHCDGYCAAAVAHNSNIVSIGIDAERNEPLPEDVLKLIARQDEISALHILPSSQVCWDRLLFCAKESVYKAWFPITKRWLGFEEACITIDPCAGTFRLQFFPKVTSKLDLSDSHFIGRYIASREHIFTSVTVYRDLRTGASDHLET
jgi:4'-phosphopantetheinyl transferase EntD